LEFKAISEFKVHRQLEEIRVFQDYRQTKDIQQQLALLVFRIFRDSWGLKEFRLRSDFTELKDTKDPLESKVLRDFSLLRETRASRDHRVLVASKGFKVDLDFRDGRVFRDHKASRA
jgi:hypothetical protein